MIKKNIKIKPFPFLPILFSSIVILIVVGFYARSLLKNNSNSSLSEAAITTIPQDGQTVFLPAPKTDSRYSLEKALYNRRSRRSFLDKALDLSQVSQILWAAQGVTTDWGGRTAPSAKSAYPLTVYLVANKVTNLTSGLYQYIPGDKKPVHQLTRLIDANLQDKVYEIINQTSVKESPALIVLAGDFSKSTPNNNYLEAGHIAQNIYLQAESLSLGTVVVAGFDIDKLRQDLNLPDTQTIVYVIPFGSPKE